MTLIEFVMAQRYGVVNNNFNMEVFMATKQANVVLEVDFAGEIVMADAKTGMVSLNDIFEVGNTRRVAKGLPAKELKKFFENDDTIEFMDALVKHENVDILNGEKIAQLENPTSKDILTISKRGRYGGTWGHLLLAVKLATWLDKDFEVQVYKTFVEGKLFDFRLLGIDNYKLLCSSMSRKFYCDSYDYSDVATEINKKCNNGEFIKGWNYRNATPEIQKLRNDLMDFVIRMLDMEMIRSKNDVLRVIESYRV